MAAEAIGLVDASTKEYTGDGHVIVDGEVKYARFGGGFSVDATINLGGSNYLGPVQEIKRSIVETSIENSQMGFWGCGGITGIPKLGVTESFVPANNKYMFSTQLNIGLGIPIGPVPINGASGVYNHYT